MADQSSIGTECKELSDKLLVSTPLENPSRKEKDDGNGEHIADDADRVCDERRNADDHTKRKRTP